MTLDLYIYEKSLKLIRNRKDQVQEQLMHGIVEDFTMFKELRAKYQELATIEQELKSLLNKVSDNEDNEKEANSTELH
tara:strand:+ start:565 stop:798 length:234 start_codon:yes stop_codon:yes gene_type:complete